MTSTRPLRVLLAEDSPIDAKLILHELRKNWPAVELERVETAEAMRQALRDEQWDVVLSDWAMPAFSAPRAHAVVHELGLEVPFIIVSGTIGEETAVEAMRTGAHDYVLKDKLGRLIPAIQRELRESETRAARREAESRLRVSEARFRRLWDSGIVLIAIIDVRGGIRDINEAGASMLGYTREELLGSGLRWRDMTPPEWASADRAAVAAIAEKGVAIPYEKELLRKDGTRLPILTGVAQLEGSRGISIAVDLSHQKATERALIERMRGAALSGEIGVILTEDDPLPVTLQRCAEAMVVHIGAAFARIWTLAPGESVLELRASAGLYTHLDGAHARVPVGQMKIGTIAAERRPHRTNDLPNDSLVGDPEWARRTSMRAFAGHPLLVGGEVVGVIGLFARESMSEVTLAAVASIADAIAIRIRGRHAEQARLALEQQLLHAQKMEAVGRLAGGVAHDFNNILSAILSYGDLVLGELEPGQQIYEDVEEIRNAATRAAELTRQLLLFSRQEVTQPKILDLNATLTGLEKMLRRLLGEDVVLVLELASDLGRVEADPGHIEQVIMNLVINARDAMPQGGHLTIRTAYFSTRTTPTSTPR